MLEVVQAEYVEGYKLKVSFSSGERGVVDLADALWGPGICALAQRNTVPTVLPVARFAHHCVGE